jgi:hypothetical protein
MKGHPNNIVGQITYIISEQLGAPHGMAPRPPLDGVGHLQLHQAVCLGVVRMKAVASTRPTAVCGTHHHLLQVAAASEGYHKHELFFEKCLVTGNIFRNKRLIMTFSAVS